MQETWHVILIHSADKDYLTIVNNFKISDGFSLRVYRNSCPLCFHIKTNLSTFRCKLFWCSDVNRCIIPRCYRWSGLKKKIHLYILFTIFFKWFSQVLYKCIKWPSRYMHNCANALVNIEFKAVKQKCIHAVLSSLHCCHASGEANTLFLIDM